MCVQERERCAAVPSRGAGWRCRATFAWSVQPGSPPATDTGPHGPARHRVPQHSAAHPGRHAAAMRPYPHWPLPMPCPLHVPGHMPNATPPRPECDGNQPSLPPSRCPPRHGYAPPTSTRVTTGTTLYFRSASCEGGGGGGVH